jgi:dienelactone hydrolase
MATATIVPKEAVQKLVAKLSSSGITITHRVIPGANHFFYTLPARAGGGSISTRPARALKARQVR